MVAPKKPKASAQKAKSATKKKVSAGNKKAAAAPKKVSVSGPVKKAMNKTELFEAIAEETNLTKKEIKMVFESLSNQIERHIKPRGAGECTLPGLMKIKTIKKKATKERKGINPFTGQPTVFKGRPAHTVVKIRPLAKLKIMVNE